MAEGERTSADAPEAKLCVSDAVGVAERCNARSNTAEDGRGAGTNKR